MASAPKLTIASSTRTWSNDEAAEYLGCTPDTLRVWVSKRRVPFFKVGRLTRFSREDLRQWLEERRVSVMEEHHGH